MAEPRGAEPSIGQISKKGLSAGSVGILGAIVVGISCIAPAYTLTGALGPTVSQVGLQAPAVLILGFIPMLLVAIGYRELNQAMPDSGTSFTWGVRAFGPWVGWMAGWGLISATVIVLSNLAGIAVEFFYLALGQIFSNDSLANLHTNTAVNVVTALVFISAATWVTYRDMQTTQRFQYALVTIQIVIMLIFAITAIVKATDGSSATAIPFQWSMLNPLEISSFSALAAGLSFSIFIYWGWDVVLTMTEETRGSHSTPGKAATLTMVIVIGIYLITTVGLMMFAGIGTEPPGLNQPELENAFFFLAGPVLGPFAILISLCVLLSSAASLQSTAVGPARTLLAMGHYGALSPRFSRLHPRFLTPGYATIVSACVAGGFYALMRLISENVLWDTIQTLGMMVCFYYGITALCSAWYFRKQMTNLWKALVKVIFPLVGGLMLLILFVKTFSDAMDPNYGSGSSIGGVGLVFVLGVTILLAGVICMVLRYLRHPDFFRGKGIHRGIAGDDVEKEFSLDDGLG